jgi:hypothetical protein
MESYRRGSRACKLTTGCIKLLKELKILRFFLSDTKNMQTGFCRLASDTKDCKNAFYRLFSDTKNRIFALYRLISDTLKKALVITDLHK